MLINKLIKQLFNKKISPKISYLFLYYRMIVIITKKNYKIQLFLSVDELSSKLLWYLLFNGVKGK